MEQTDRKICRKCGKSLPLDQFNKNKACRDGLQSYCRACMAEAGREYYARIRQIPKAMDRLRLRHKAGAERYRRKKGIPERYPVTINNNVPM